MSEELKRRAAEASLSYVTDGMLLGLGSGSTAAHVVTLLGLRVAAGLQVRGVATSAQTERLARDAGVPLTSLEENPELDLCIDGADEIGPGLALIKGGGGALLREKIVAAASRRMIVVAESRKHVRELGAFPLPLEVAAFGLKATALALERAAAALGLTVTIKVRTEREAAFVTENGNRILDASFGRIPNPEALADRLADIPGILEQGLFIGLADRAILAAPDGISELEA